MTVRGIRGATTFDVDERSHVAGRVSALLDELVTRNEIPHDDIVSIIFNATAELRSVFPAEIARLNGFGDVPLLCAQELEIDGALPRCVRILLHVNTDKRRDQIHHVYLEGAVGLRDDLPE